MCASLQWARKNNTHYLCTWYVSTILNSGSVAYILIWCFGTFRSPGIECHQFMQCEICCLLFPLQSVYGLQCLRPLYPTRALRLVPFRLKPEDRWPGSRDIEADDTIFEVTESTPTSFNLNKVLVNHVCGDVKKVCRLPIRIECYFECSFSQKGLAGCDTESPGGGPRSYLPRRR